jgi:hypothetical protein
MEQRELGDAHVMAIRLGFVMQYLGGVSTIVCGYSSFYYSTRTNGSATTYMAHRWSYASFFCLVASSAALSLNNVSHPDEQTLPGKFVLNLVVATANIAHSVRVKYVIGGANLLVGIVMVYYCPRLYPPTTFVPLLSAITGTCVRAVFVYALVSAFEKMVVPCIGSSCVYAVKLKFKLTLSRAHPLSLLTHAVQYCTGSPTIGFPQ